MVETPDILSAALRIASLILLVSAAGTAIFIALFGRLLSATLAPVTRFGWRLSLAAMVVVAAHHALEAARMTGEMSGALDPALQIMSLRSAGGAALAAKLLGLALAAIGLKWGVRWLLLAGPLVSVAAFALTGHTAVSPHRPLAAMLVTVHLLIVAFWTGALWPLYRAAGEEQPQAAARLIEAFSRIAAWVVPGILLAGIALTVLLVPGLGVFREPYGRLLLTKLALFVALMCLATLNKYRFGPACAHSDTRTFRLSVMSEYVVICGVLAVTAVMTMFFSPEAP